MSVSKSGFYKWNYRRKKPNPRELARQANIKLIKQVHKGHPSHGYRWINAFIKNKYPENNFSDNYVHRICKYEGIRSQGKHYQWKKPGDEQYKFSNLVWNGWKAINKPFQVIISDMTSFYVKGIYYELTFYFDAWNKEILGYGLDSRKGSIRTYFDGIKQVLPKIKDQTDDLVILHTDQGSVYSSRAYNDLIQDYNISQSMSRAGTPTDNPVNESLNGWIKEELFIDFKLKESDNVHETIKDYVFYYNNIRPSYALRYKTPIQYKLELGYDVFY